MWDKISYEIEDLKQATQVSHFYYFDIYGDGEGDDP